MKIGPVDIRNHSFSRKLNGVDEAEVRAFLELVADRLEDSIMEAEDLRGRIDRLELRVDEYSKLERALRDSLISAERVVEDRRHAAEKESRIRIKNAEVDAEKIVLNARGELGRLRAEIDDLRRQKVTYVERFRALLRSQVKILEASVEEFDPDNANHEVRSVLDEVERAERTAGQMPLGYADPRPSVSPSPRTP